ncbi:hypothetical protein Tco_1399958 [Tanacetum coccineum]
MHWSSSLNPKLEEVEELLEEEMLVSSSNHLLMVIWMSFGNGSSSGCHGGLWVLWRIEEDGEVVYAFGREFYLDEKSVQAFWVRIADASRFDVQIEDHHFVQKKWEHHIVGNRESQYVEIEEIDEFLQEWEGREWDYEDLTELLERESDEFILNHEGDKNDAGVISLKSDLTIKV